jgi:hypothetical protein
MKLKSLFVVIGSLLSLSAISNVEDGVQVLGTAPSDSDIEMVRAGAKAHCKEITDYEEKEQCAMDYYAAHNFDGEPDCEE